MTTDLDQAREQLQDIIQWWPILDDVADSLLGITGHGVDLAGIHTAGGTSRVEIAILQLEEIQQISIDLTALARKMGYRPGLDGTAHHYVHANLAWARTNLAPADYEPTIAHIHRTIARLAGHAPRPTGRTCPACGQDQLKLLDDERLYCGACDITRHPDEIAALTSWRITSSTINAPLPLVAKHLGIKPSRIRQWITRGLIHRTETGHIPINTARQLAQETQ